MRYVFKCNYSYPTYIDLKCVKAYYNFYFAVGSELNSATLSSASEYIFLHLSKKKCVSSTATMELYTKLAEVSVKDGAFTHIMRYLSFLTGRIISWFDSDQGIVELLHTVVHLGLNEWT